MHSAFRSIDVLSPSFCLLPFVYTRLSTPGMPATGYYGVSVTIGYRTTRKWASVSANEMSENRAAFNFTSYHHMALRFVRRTSHLASPLTLDPTLPSRDITSCVLFQHRHTVFVLYLSSMSLYIFYVSFSPSWRALSLHLLYNFGFR